MSIVSYNGITLPFADISDFFQEAIGDDLSDTDWVYTKFDITINCILNYNYLSQVAPTLLVGGVASTNTAADIMNVIRSKLLARRQTLSIKFNGVELIPQKMTGATQTVDARNGPIPEYCRISNLTNNTFYMSWKIRAHYWENNKVTPTVDGTAPGGVAIINQTGNRVLWNRWSESIDIDNLQYSTYTRTGKFVIRSDNGGKIADELTTQMCVVGVKQGCLRKSSKYKVDPNGLGIEYSLVDEEVYLKPPTPAYEADGEYIESLTKAGAKRFGEARVALKGSKTTSQADLVTAAVALVSKVLADRARTGFKRILLPPEVQAFGGPADIVIPGLGFGVLQGATLRRRLFKNEVECSARMMYANNAGGFTFKSLPTSVPTVKPDYTPSYPVAGTANLLLHAAAYYDPSIQGVKIDSKTGQFNVLGFEPGQ